MSLPLHRFGEPARHTEYSAQTMDFASSIPPGSRLFVEIWNDIGAAPGRCIIEPSGASVVRDGYEKRVFR